MDQHHNNSLMSSTGSVGSPLNTSINSGSNVMVDNDKIQKIISNYQKLKNQNALLKKAIIQEQQKNEELDKELKLKEQALTTTIQEHDILEFNNQRLTKRISTMQDEMNNKKDSGSWFSGNKSKQELQKKEDELNLLRSELQDRIEDNASLHTVTNEKETAFKQMEASLRKELEEKDNFLEEKDTKITELLTIQKNHEKTLNDQTQGLRTNINNLQSNIKKILNSLKLRDDILNQTNDLVKNCIDNSPLISIDYPIENITPSGERIGFEQLIFEKDFSVDIDQTTIDSLVSQANWKNGYRTMISNIQSLFSHQLSQVSNLISSHNDQIKNIDKKNQLDQSVLNESINQLTLHKEENEFTLHSIKEELTQKDQTILTLNRQISDQKDILVQLTDANRNYQDQVEKDKETLTTTKTKLENELEELKQSHKKEIQHLSDQHQGLLKHQKQLLTSKVDEQKSLITQLEKKNISLETLVKQYSQQQQQQQPIVNNTSNIDNQIETVPVDSEIGNNDLNIESSSNETDKEEEKKEDDIVVVIPNQNDSDTNTNNNSSTQTITPSSLPSISSSSSVEPSGRFKLTVLDETGEKSNSLNLTFEDKEREKELKNYYENKITQLLNKISNVDAKAIRYYEQYNQLLKKGQENESTMKLVERAQLEAKNTREELEVTRANYDQQLNLLTEQYISLNESITSLDADLLRIKQHKVACGKCKAINTLDHVFAPENLNLICCKGNHQIQTITP